MFLYMQLVANNVRCMVAPGNVPLNSHLCHLNQHFFIDLHTQISNLPAPCSGSLMLSVYALSMSNVIVVSWAN